MTLYLKYRPQTIEELDLTRVREELKKIVKSKKIPHALLFSGPKGTGKTSAARILAKVINCEDPDKSGEPCNKCSQCTAITKGSSLDVIELDAASNRGIDDIRSLRDAVKLSPVSARKKIYVVDEAHMLTTEAANAFLKTLEEPPDHVVFILATTNPEKLIPTVRSRLANIVFAKATVEEIKRQLVRVVKGEKWEAENEALEIIAGAADGSFRDAVKILEQIMVESGRLTFERAQEYVLHGKTVSPEEFIKIVTSKEIKEVIAELENLVEKGGSVKELIEGMIVVLHNSLLAKYSIGGKDNLGYLSKEDNLSLIEILMSALRRYSDTPLPHLSLEMELISWKKDASIAGPSEKLDTTVKSKVSVVKDKKVDVLNRDGEVQETSKNGDPGTEFSMEMWQRVLFGVKNKNISVEALLRSSKPLSFDGKNLQLGVYYKFHKERLEVNSYRKTLEEVVESVVGAPVRIICILTQPPKKELVTEVKEQGNALTESKDVDIMEAAKEIFGS